MSSPRLRVSDKVVLHEHWLPGETHLRPRPKHGCVYCVRTVVEDSEGRQFIRLVGLRCRQGKLTGQEVSVTAGCFRRVSSSPPAVAS